MKKQSYSIDMLNGLLAGKLLVFAIPLTASTLLQTLFNTADAIVVGRFASTEAPDRCRLLRPAGQAALSPKEYFVTAYTHGSLRCPERR